ncbi:MULTISPECIES: sensor histidine kinase [Bacillaceae]|uniref:histidine kinase n=1 Tax=Evansella alkalicola TaxID=745819 RepID=A0ABS6JZ55_9BACI|nr:MULTISPECIES: sensor histidine kinase [Bacillaceae]MBU9723875.1 sensor histidine kinase [Bacillus alkalicola]
MARDQKKRFEIFPRRYGFFPYVFLIYVTMPIYNLRDESGWKLVVGGLLIAMFLVTYRQLYFSFETKAFVYWLGLQVAIIMILATFYNINNIFLGFFPANFIGWFPNKTAFYRALVLFAVALLIPISIHIQSFDGAGLFFFLIFCFIMLLSPFGIRSMNSRMELEQRLEEANERIEELVKREERMRIARDLHDTLGHTLSLLTLKAQLVSKLTTKDAARAKTEAAEMERTCRTALAQVRELVSDMRSTSVAESLVESESILKAAGISFDIHGDTNLESLPSVTENILSLCLKEAITNVVRHSGADHCTVSLEKTEGEVTIMVDDNGVGFEQSEDFGNGLSGMKERLELIDGKMTLLGEKGTQLILSVPIIVQERKEGALS